MRIGVVAIHALSQLVDGEGPAGVGSNRLVGRQRLSRGNFPADAIRIEREPTLGGPAVLVLADRRQTLVA
jgi:hypothetical protein